MEDEDLQVVVVEFPNSHAEPAKTPSVLQEELMYVEDGYLMATLCEGFCLFPEEGALARLVA